MFLGVVVVDPHPGNDRRVEFLERPEHLFPVPDLPVKPLHLVVVIAVALARKVDVAHVVRGSAEHLSGGLFECRKPVGDKVLRSLWNCIVIGR